MARLNLCKDCEIVRADTPTAAGFGDTISSDAIQVDGAESVLCLVVLGTVTATGTATVKVKSSDSSTTDFTTVTGATVAGADDDDDKILAVEILRPNKKYLMIDVARATANVEIDDMIAVLQRNRNSPITQGATHGATPVAVIA